MVSFCVWLLGTFVYAKLYRGMKCSHSESMCRWKYSQKYAASKTLWIAWSHMILDQQNVKTGESKKKTKEYSRFFIEKIKNVFVLLPAFCLIVWLMTAIFTEFEFWHLWRKPLLVFSKWLFSSKFFNAVMSRINRKNVNKRIKKSDFF